MNNSESAHFSGEVAIFLDKRLPEKAIPAGYSALIDAFNLKIPLPRTLCAIGQHHKIYQKEGWHILTPRHAPKAALWDHLNFALKYEGIDLSLLKRLFLAVGPQPFEDVLRGKKTSTYARRIWFLYEWLLGRELDIPNAGKTGYVLLLNPDMQWAIEGTKSVRHKVINNLPGTVNFCPLVFRTKVLDRFVEMELALQAKSMIAKVPRDLLARTAAFLLLKDSKASYAIEGEHPTQNRIQRWGSVIGEAGRSPLDLDELLRLQRIVIGDARFVRLGLRSEGCFVGEHDRDTYMPLPEHIGADPKDLRSLVNGLISFEKDIAQHLDGPVAAAILAFGFVYIHPFEDGNGRIHRYLIHHILAQRGFNPPGVHFPVSAAILENIHEYRSVLEDYSKRLLPIIEWESTADNNIRVLNDTADFYRFFDATPHVEFIYQCIQKTIQEDLPRETAFLNCYDKFRESVKNRIEMPDRTLDLLFHFLQQNRGVLSKRGREKEFVMMTEQEVVFVEGEYAKFWLGSG